MEANGHPQTNGHDAPPLEALRERVEAARLTAELRRLETEATLYESLLPGLAWGAASPSWSDVYDPGFSGRGDWWPVGVGVGSRVDRADGHNRPFVFDESQLDTMRSQARWLATRNSLAQGALRTLTNFTVRKGYAWEARPEKGREADPTAASLAAQAQAVLDQFHDSNGWSQRERSLYTRSKRDGECFLRHFAQGDGTTLVRHVDPEQVRQPLGSPPEWSYGVRTERGDVETVRSYAVAYDALAPDEWDEIPGEEVTHLKLNVDECTKRGLSDFYSTADFFEGTWKLLRNMREAGAIQAAIAWVEEFDNTSQAAIDRHVGAVKDQNRPQIPNPISGRSTPSQRMEPGTVVKTSSGRKYLPGPLASSTPQHVAIVQACLRAVGARWNMPEFMISADASNANYASTLVAGSPFVTSVECDQEVYGLYFLRSQWIALKNACAAGLVRLPDGRACDLDTLQRYVDIHYTPPQVAIADVLEEARVDHLDIAAGVMSLQTRRNRRDLDSDQERANMLAEPPTRVTGRVVDIDAAGNPVQGGGGGGGAAGGGGFGGTREGRLREDKDELGHGSEKRGGSHDDDEPADAVSDAIGEVEDAWDEQQGKVSEASEKVAQRLYDEIQAEGEDDPEPDEPELPDEPEEPDYPDPPDEPDVERPAPQP